MARRAEPKRLFSSFCLSLSFQVGKGTRSRASDVVFSTTLKHPRLGLGRGQRPSPWDSRYYFEVAGFFSGCSNFSLDVLRVMLFANSVIADFGSAPCNTIFCRVA